MPEPTPEQIHEHHQRLFIKCHPTACPICAATIPVEPKRKVGRPARRTRKDI